MSKSVEYAPRRVVHYVLIPALLVVMDSLMGYLQTGKTEIDWRAVGIVGLTALSQG